MTAPLVLEQLDVSSPALIAEWERAFYKGFSHVTGNRLIRTLWQWDDEQQRLATRIPYADQVIYYWRDPEGIIASSIATNIAMTQFQSSAFGFQPDRSDGSPRSCELIAAFSLSDRSFSHVIEVRNAALADLYERGFRRAYLTTADKIYNLWMRCGARVLGEALIEGERRRFLEFPLNPSGVPGPPARPARPS